MTIHADHPFMPDPEDRDPLRRFRGRLAMPITIVTAGTPEARTGLTVSSVLVTEGEPGEAVLLVNPNTDLWDAIEKSGRLMIHVCSPEHRGLAEVFAGHRPNPGGLFAGMAVTDGPWGPVLEDVADRLGVSVTSMDRAGWTELVRGRVEQVDLGGQSEPLLYHRGRYRTLG